MVLQQLPTLFPGPSTDPKNWGCLSSSASPVWGCWGLLGQCWVLSEPSITHWGEAQWKWAPGFRHPVPAHPPSLPHTPDNCCLSFLVWGLHPSSKARILGFHTPNPPLGLPQQLLQKPAVLKALAPREPGGRRCRVGWGRGRAGIPSHPRHISHSGHALASQGAGLSSIQAPHWLPCSRGTPESRNLGVVGGEGVSALLPRETLETAAGWVGGPQAPWTSGSSST